MNAWSGWREEAARLGAPLTAGGTQVRVWLCHQGSNLYPAAPAVVVIL